MRLIPLLVTCLTVGGFLAIGSGCASTDSAPAMTGSGDPLVPLAWLSGTWTDAEPADSVTEECWSAPRGATLFGSNRTIRGGNTVAFEFLRIVARDDDTTVYIAQPGGRSPGVEFPLIELEGTRAVFANPDHDFPQRLEYALEEGILTVTVTGEEDGRTRGFRQRWRRTGD